MILLNVAMNHIADDTGSRSVWQRGSPIAELGIAFLREIVMRRSLLVALCFSVWTLLAAPLGFANGVFQSVRGEVTATVGTAAPVSVGPNQQVVPGTIVTTGPGAQTVIRFDDGHTVVLSENTEFRVTQYSFDKDKPQSDNIALQILKGAMRSVSGLIASRNHGAFSLVAPQATIGIRGTDFMVALVNPAYLSVLQGTISATNPAGSASFSAGANAMVASPTSLAVAIPASALPPSVASTFNNLSSVAIGTGAGAATGAASGGITAGMVAAGVAVVGVAAAASSSNGSGNAATTTTTTTQ